MESLFKEALTVMRNAFHHLERSVPQPQIQQWNKGTHFRYEEKSIEQALVQKLARTVSGLTAIDVLLSKGLGQEQGIMQRVLDEIGEDVQFLTLAITDDSITRLHQEYLAAFFAEEFNEGGSSRNDKKPNNVPRKKIRAYLLRVGHKTPNDFKLANALATLSSASSGFVHAASPHIMEMYGGSPPRFHVEGMLNTPRMSSYTQDAWNYFNRGLMSFGVVAAALKKDHLFLSLDAYLQKFEEDSATLRKQ
jgi:hypothetical protein